MPATLLLGASGFRAGWRINVGVDFDSCGMNDAVGPARFGGGVTLELSGLGVENRGESASDLALTRGMPDGDA